MRTTSHSPVLAVTSGATFLAFLDVTVVNLAFPDLARDLRSASITDLSWVITAYAVTLAALLAAAGRVADVLGRRRAFLAGVVGFGLSSAAAAAAPTLGTLVVARAVQGGSAALMIPASLGLLLQHTAAAERAKAIAAWGAAGAFAAAVGPALGGALVDVAGWRSVFLINLPVVVAILLGCRRVPRDSSRTGELPEVLGTATLAGGIGLLVLGISQGTEWGWVAAPTLGSLSAGLILLLAALRLSATSTVPALEVGLWRDAAFATTNAVNLVYGAVLFAWMLVGVIFLTQAWGYGELRAGVAMSPGALGATVGALAGGRLVDRFGQRAVAAAGAAVMGLVGLGLLAVLPADPSFLTVWLPGGLVSGVGMGLVATSLSSAAAVAVPPQKFAAGLGLNMTARQFGGALGVAGLTAYLQASTAAPVDSIRWVYGASGLLALLGAALSTGLPHQRATQVAAGPARVPDGSGPEAFEAVYRATLDASSRGVEQTRPWVARLWFTPWRAQPGDHVLAREATWLEPTTPVTIQAGRHQLAGFTAGDGPTVLLVHGWVDQASRLGAFVRPLLARGYRVLAVDLPGHGGSGDAPTDLYSWTDALAAVIEQENVQAVVAHSLGGQAVTRALMTQPSVRAVALLAPAVRLEHSMGAFASMFALPPVAIEALREEIEHRFGPDVWHDTDADRAARELHVPALVVHSADDEQVTTADADLLVRSWAGARLLRVQGLGHSRLLRDETVISEVTGFLTAATRPARASA